MFFYGLRITGNLSVELLFREIGFLFSAWFTDMIYIVRGSGTSVLSILKYDDDLCYTYKKIAYKHSSLIPIHSFHLEYSVLGIFLYHIYALVDL